MTTSVGGTTARGLEELSRAGLRFEEFAIESADLLGRAVPFDGLCMGIVDPTTNLLTGSVKLGLGDIGDHTFLHWEYAEEDVAHFADLATRPVGVALLDEETRGDKNVSGRYREVITREIGADHELRGVTRVGGLLWGTYAMYRASGASAFNAAEADFLQRLETTLAMGIRASTLVDRAAAALGSGGTGPAVLVFAAMGALAHATPTAAERLDDLGGSVDGELPVAVSAIVSAVRGSRESTTRPAAAAQTRARGRSGCWYSLHAAPFAAGGAEHPQIAVTVEPATPPQILPLLTAAYGLTDREASIVQAMLRGESTHAIAQSLFLSPYTVQDHFKSIFEKIDVSSRREVATRVFYGNFLTAGDAG
jgi:DNA-binding CsgD family transcriptional regulator